jgi:hypothetical protein
MGVRATLTLLLLVCLAGPEVFAADESLLLEDPPTKSVGEEKGPLERAFEEPPPRDPVLFPGAKRALSDLPAFFRDTQLSGDFRTYYLRRRFAERRNAEALAIGGAFRYRSGWFQDHLQIGAAVFTSQRLYGPTERDGTGLLGPGQRGYTVVGEAFGRLRAANNELTVYRQPLAMPYVNGNDGRMTPNTFEGVTLIGRHPLINYSIGYLFEMKQRNADNFASFSEVAGVPGSSDDGLSFVGIELQPTESLSIGAINHFVKDTLNTAYTEIEWRYLDTAGWGIRLGTQYTHQRSVGDDNLTGDRFETWIWDGKIAASWKEMVLSVAVSITDGEDRIRNPWGSYPGYVGMMQSNFSEAREKAWSVSTSTYLGLIGLSNLSLALRYAEGYDARSVRTGSEIGDHREVNATLDYRLRSGSLRGLWLRARFAWSQIENASRDAYQVRLILRYDFEAI